MSRIFVVLLIVAVVLIGVFYFLHLSATRSLTSGDVHVHDGATPARTDAPSDSAQSQPATDQTQPGVIDNTTAGAQPAAAQTAPQPAPQPAQQSAGQFTPPPGDSIDRNPPNGMTFAGTGHYQVYRQGNLTWRINTDSGQACILFATDSEWRKARVFRNGCNGKS